MEIQRRAGYRRVGGIYLVSSKLHTNCELLPQPLKRCSHCGEGPNISRNITRLIPFNYFEYNEVAPKEIDCKVCNPPKGIHYLMIVGKHLYPTPQYFINEAKEHGVSKRVPFIANHIIYNQTVIYLAHEKATPVGWGIFGYFIPERAEKLIWESGLEDLDPRLTFIRVPDGDMRFAAYKDRVLKPITKTSNIIDI